MKTLLPGTEHIENHIVLIKRITECICQGIWIRINGNTNLFPIIAAFIKKEIKAWINSQLIIHYKFNVKLILIKQITRKLKWNVLLSSSLQGAWKTLRFKFFTH